MSLFLEGGSSERRGYKGDITCGPSRGPGTALGKEQIPLTVEVLLFSSGNCTFKEKTLEFDLPEGGKAARRISWGTDRHGVRTRRKSWNEGHLWGDATERLLAKGEEGRRWMQGYGNHESII